MEIPKSGGEIDDEPSEDQPDPIEDIEAVWQHLSLDNFSIL